MPGGASAHETYDQPEDWRGLLAGRPRPDAEASIFAIADVADSGSRPFLGLSTDGRQFWVKYQGNLHGVDALVSERVVASLAAKIGAPMRKSVLVDVPEPLVGDPRLVGSGIRAGVAHGSPLLDDCTEKEVLDSVAKDHNRFRQPRFIALWELFLGADGQWLYDHANDHQVWSFDHGFWTNGGEPSAMSGSDYQNLVHTWSDWPGSVRGMDSGTFLETAAQLEALSVFDLIDVVSGVPVAWRIPDENLECLAWWLHARKPHIADRMRALANQASNSGKKQRRAR